MQICSIRADNFKSLVDFELPLSPFNCLVGLNGAGKSTVLQFIDFLARQVRGDLKGWLEDRNWKARDINSRLTDKRNIEFSVTLRDSNGSEVTWEAGFNTSKLRCTTERIKSSELEMTVDGGGLIRVHSSNGEPVDETELENLSGKRLPFSYEGSLLSQLKESLLPVSILRMKQFFEGAHSLDLLSPELLRQRTREAGGSLGLGGRQLSAFLSELTPLQRASLTKQLKKAYGRLTAVHTTSLRSGWKQLEVSEQYRGRRLLTEARHLNDGMLRLLAILAELQTDHQFVLFDEIENGINPELVEFVIDALVNASQQIVVTTHSPLILNFVEDEVARAGVIYLYRNREGCTRAVRLFDIPSLRKKLTVLGPGEAFVDTNLSALSREISAMKGGR